MRRKEKNQRYVFSILSFVLVFSVLLVGVRIAFATNDLRPQDITGFSNVHGTITDRFDQPIYENGKVLNYKLYGNVVGDGQKIGNALVNRYAEYLQPGKINPFAGYRSMETEPRVMHTTLLSENSLNSIAKIFGKNKGCCFAYNYETGEVYAALTFPSYNPGKANSSFINRCFDELYIPGSTMKVITTVLAVEQGINLNKITYDCDGTYELPDGNEIKCAYRHGRVNYTDAIGKSCNGYFVKVANEFNIDKTLTTFRNLGFITNQKEDRVKIETQDFRILNSSVKLTNTTSYSNAWAFAGQGKTEVNVVHMAMLAGAIANGGKTAMPYMVKSVYNPDKDKNVYEYEGGEMVEYMSPKTASTVAKLWKPGVNKYYYSEYNLSSKITYAKTGTAQNNANKADNNRLLMGVMEDSKTAFYIVVEGHSDTVPFLVANQLAAIISKQ